MEKRCYAQLTWIDSGNTTFKEKEKACQDENPKAQPRQKLRQENPARLKTRKGNLDKSQGKDHRHGENSRKEVMGKSYMAKEKEKKKKK